MSYLAVAGGESVVIKARKLLGCSIEEFAFLLEDTVSAIILDESKDNAELGRLRGMYHLIVSDPDWAGRALVEHRILEVRGREVGPEQQQELVRLIELKRKFIKRDR